MLGRRGEAHLEEATLEAERWSLLREPSSATPSQTRARAGRIDRSVARQGHLSLSLAAAERQWCEGRLVEERGERG